jgi:excinuclease ABC subunit B
LRQLIKIQYERNDVAFKRGQFRVQGEMVYIFLATGESIIKLELLGDTIENIYISDVRSSIIQKAENKLEEIIILPGKHFMTPEEKMKDALVTIRAELKERLKVFKKQKKIVEAQRLERKTNYDLEMIEEIGYCNGIENYSRHLSGREAGAPSQTLLDFFPKDYLIFADESHVTMPQIRGMYAGDQSRKKTLIDFGFRLPSAIDNRPLNFPEFDARIKNIIYVSATPQEYELRKSKQVVQQVIRPTGLLDPVIEVRPNKNQIADLIKEIEIRAKKNQRILVTVLTKRMAEELSDYLSNEKIKVCWLHSEVLTLERIDILHDLRSGRYDVLVGVNLLREGLDLPEVSLVAILDADISGFLRNDTALIQTIGRAARHLEGKVIMYANKISPAMKIAIRETNRRRKIQEKYNQKHNITPEQIAAKMHEKIG